MAETGGDGGVLRQLVAIFGFGVDDSELKKGENRLNQFLGKVKEVAEGVAAAFAVEQVYEFAESQAAAMNAIERTSSMLGMSTERVQQYQFAAKSLGLDINAVTDSISRMQVAQQMASEGGKEQAEAFRWVGTNIKDANGHMKDANALFLDVADGISKMVDPAKQAAAAQYIFGRSGRALLPFLKEGRKGVEEYFAVYKELGGGYDKDAIEKGREFDKQSARTNLTLTALKNTIAKAVLPIVTAISHALEKTVKWINEVTKHTHVVQAALIAFGAAALVFVAPLIAAAAPVLLLAAGIVALILALEDLYGFLTGKQSATGEILDKIFGKGAQVKILQQVKDAWADIRDVFRDLANWVEKVVDGIKWITDHGKPAVSRGKEFGPKTAEDDGREAGLLEAEKRIARNKAWRDIFGDTIVDAFTNRTFGDKNKATLDQALGATDFTHLFGGSSPTIAHPGGGPGGDTNINVGDINIANTNGLDAKQVGIEVVKHIDERIKQRNRAAFETVPHAGT